MDEALTDLPEESDTVATIYFRLAYLHQVKEPPNLAVAEKYYTLAILYDPRSPTPYFNRGLVYWGQDEVDNAIDDYTESLFRNPRDSKALHLRGFAYLERNRPGDVIRAIDDFTKSIEIDDSVLENFFNRGLAYFKLGGAHDDQSLEDLHHILSIESDHTGSLNNLCWFMCLGGRAEEGLPYCERALSIDSDYYLAYDSRGLAYAMLGDYEKALKDFTKFLEWLDSQPREIYDRYGPRREKWVESLRKGENPFDEAELLALRNE